LTGEGIIWPPTRLIWPPGLLNWEAFTMPDCKKQGLLSGLYLQLILYFMDM
jgi:hypothetical protein